MEGFILSDHKIRVLALGGCGDMGRFAVQTALDQVQDVYTGWNIAEATAEPPEGGFSPDMLKAPDYQPSAASSAFCFCPRIS